MKEKIIENIARLSLHDSHIEKIEITKDKLILTIDWAKLDNYLEKEIDEGLILGKCELVFDGINEEKLRLDFSGIPGKENIEPKEIQFDIELFHDWLILENKAISKNKYCISGLIDLDNGSAWLDWSFLFSNFKLTWNNSITWIEWQNGKFVNE
ncbi:hypothetical protein ACE939_04265 [Aquimarina sp. W85]|uniref:hypothetical protein n=1 Tax=Aquimarina rhodophyticola TaxID=3342246 RepID=UPI003671E373